MSVPQVVLVGAGMIAHDQILPSLFQLQRKGAIGEITICSQHGKSITALRQAPGIQKAFPGQTFRRFPADDSGPHPEMFREAIAKLPPRQIVVAAIPDQLHYDVVMAALEHDQHVCCVKPLVLKTEQSVTIEREARARGLVVGVEYHKRFDDRSLLARRRFREGLFGEFKLGTACLMEKWYYRRSNFQNWCTVENSDAFTYIGCHYVDLVHFITGLLPASVSVYGIRDRYPNGNEGFLWTDARVLWENGACLNVQNSLSFPDAAPGTNTQGITMYFAGRETGAWLEHSDQYRGLRYSYVRNPAGDGATQFAEPSPDYFQYVDLGGPGMEVVGYGYRSIDFLIRQCLRIEQEASSLAERQHLLAEMDKAGVMATPANSRYNELVTEAGRLSILNEGREVAIEYGDSPRVFFRH
ncbi:MAG TPA: Gfo/Idh/MocA family oxidoreductase [Bryobacteraceae bacterium]|nr:Gfo/Idh/MocA family oxidoreductase [Bryobacteraceae bacterium]